jgi:hypothetical protein
MKKVNFMKCMAIFLSLCITLNVFASSGVTEELKKDFDDYQYALTVDWDQKDSMFYENQTNLFYSRLSSLITDKGLTQEEIMGLASSKIQDPSKLEALKLKLSVLKSTDSSEELARVLSENSKEFYAKGASWSGDAVVLYAVGALVVAAIGYTIWFTATHKCVESKSEYVCTGRPLNCRYVDVCTQYAKK